MGSERLLEKIRKKQGAQRGRGRMAFLQHKEVIARALAEGAGLKTIWQQLREDKLMPIQYGQFCRYVRKLILNAPTPPKKPAPESSPPAKATTRIRQYRHKPVPDKDDLI
jgi:hypothetical protein